MTRNLSLCWHDHPNSLVAFLQTLVNGNSLFDCTLAAEGKYVRAHKVILSACSPYFQLLFNQENDRNPIVILKDVQYECLKWVIDFVYLGEVQLRETQLKTFLEVARSLQIKGLDSSDNETVEKRSLSTHSKRRGSAFQSMESGQVIDVDNECKVERNVDRNVKTRSTGQCRTPSPSRSEDARCITIESAYSMAPIDRSDAELDDSLDSDALEWSQGSAPPSVASSAPDSADTLLVNETQERNNLKSYNENSLAKDVLIEPNLEMKKRGVLCERSDHIEPSAQTKPASRRGVGRRASGSGRRAEGEASGLEVPPRGRASNPRRKRRSLKEMPKTIACPLCPKKFARPTDFNVHNRRHTGERPYRCTTCQKRFVQACELRRHTLVHTDERPFSCGACGKRFNRSCSLKIHTRIHTGERPYACPDCDKTFAAHSQLWAHKRSHSAGKYSCDACGRRFKRKALVGQHWVKAHGPGPRVVVTKLDGGGAK